MISAALGAIGSKAAGEIRIMCSCTKLRQRVKHCTAILVVILLRGPFTPICLYPVHLRYNGGSQKGFGSLYGGGSGCGMFMGRVCGTAQLRGAVLVNVGPTREHS
jgi:hypothetical protein